MTLPCSRRPPEVEELLKEEPDGFIPGVRLRIDKKKAFMDAMVGWHESLNKKERKELTKKRVIRRAMEFAHKLDIPYKSLPENWLRTLCVKHGLDYKLSKRRKPCLYSAENNYETDSTSSGVSSLHSSEADDLEGPFIDLSNEPPPAEWIQAYIQGRAAPRHLTVHTGSDGVTIVFYDYNVENQQNTVVIPHDRDGVFPAIEVAVPDPTDSD